MCWVGGCCGLVGGWVGCELLSLHAGVIQCQYVCLVLNSSCCGPILKS